MSKFCPKCTGLVPNPSMTVCPNCGADLSNVTEDVLDMEVPINNGIGNGYVANNMNSNSDNSSNMNQQPFMNNQPKEDPTLNFANSNIFRESGNSVNKNDNASSNQTTNRQTVNGIFFNQDNNSNQYLGNVNSIPTDHNMMNNQSTTNNQNMNFNQSITNNQSMNVNQAMMDNPNFYNNQNVDANQGMDKQKKVKKGINIFNSFGKFSTKTFIIGGSALVALIIILIVSILISSGPRAVVQKYCTGVKTLNVNKVVSTYPKEMRADIKEGLTENYDELKDYYAEINRKTKKIIVSSEYEIVKKSEMSTTLDYVSKEYNIKKSNVKEIRKYKVKTVYVVDGEEKELETYICVYKIGMKWFILS